MTTKIIVLTGGPCAGKSKALKRLIPALRAHGWFVLTIPEIPTYLISNGVEIGDHALEYVDFELQVLRTQLEHENRALSIAQRIRHPHKVIICDRGVLDINAYLEPHHQDAMEARMNRKIHELADHTRYDAVIHLQTAAFQEELYKTNEVRQDSPEKARALDAKTYQAWKGHPNHFHIPLHTDVEEKMAQLLHTILGILEDPDAPKTPLSFSPPKSSEHPDETHIQLPNQSGC